MKKIKGMDRRDRIRAAGYVVMFVMVGLGLLLEWASYFYDPAWGLKGYVDITTASNFWFIAAIGTYLALNPIPRRKKKVE